MKRYKIVSTLFTVSMMCLSVVPINSYALGDVKHRLTLLEDRVTALEKENKQLKNTITTLITTGDVNNDGITDGRDATLILTYYANISVGYEGTLIDFINEQ